MKFKVNVEIEATDREVKDLMVDAARDTVLLLLKDMSKTFQGIDPSALLALGKSMFASASAMGDSATAASVPGDGPLGCRVPDVPGGPILSPRARKEHDEQMDIYDELHKKLGRSASVREVMAEQDARMAARGETPMTGDEWEAERKGWRAPAPTPSH